MLLNTEEKHAFTSFPVCILALQSGLSHLQISDIKNQWSSLFLFSKLSDLSGAGTGHLQHDWIRGCLCFRHHPLNVTATTPAFPRKWKHAQLFCAGQFLLFPVSQCIVLIFSSRRNRQQKHCSLFSVKDYIEWMNMSCYLTFGFTVGLVFGGNEHTEISYASDIQVSFLSKFWCRSSFYFPPRTIMGLL